MSWDQSLSDLRDVLATLYPTEQRSVRVVQEAGLNLAHVRFDPAAIDNWFNILDEAQKRDMVSAIVAVALKEYPENQALKRVQQENPVAMQAPRIDEEVPWRGPADVDPLEKIIGGVSDLVPISFLEVGLSRARAVARVVRADGGIGSGFLVADRLLITNHHVLDGEQTAQQAVIQFNYQKTAAGIDTPYEEFRCVPEDGFKTNKDHDWTAVRLQGDPHEKWGQIELQRTKVAVGDRVNIIQHPGGGPKQMSLYHNVVAYADAARVQYLTDTLPGSSGSPVFDRDWGLVAVHHSGGLLVEPGSKRTFYRNEGIHIDVLMEGLAAANLLVS